MTGITTFYHPESSMRVTSEDSGNANWVCDSDSQPFQVLTPPGKSDWVPDPLDWETVVYHTECMRIIHSQTQRSAMFLNYTAVWSAGHKSHSACGRVCVLQRNRPPALYIEFILWVPQHMNSLRLCQSCSYHQGQPGQGLSVIPGNLGF